MHKWSIKACDEFEMWLRRKGLYPGKQCSSQYVMFLVGPLQVGDLVYEPDGGRGWDSPPINQKIVDMLDDAVCCYAVARKIKKED